MSDDRKDLPPVTSPNFLERVRELMQIGLGNRGDKLDRTITVRDLVGADLVELRAGYLSGTGGKMPPIKGPGSAIIDAYDPDLTPPPTPTGFSATTSKTSIQVVTAPQTYTQGHGHAKTIVFGAKYLAGDALPTFDIAVKLDEFSGDVHAFPVDPASLYRLWVKWVTADGVESAPAGGTNGIEAEAGLLDSQHIAFLTASKIRAGAVSVGEYIQSAAFVAGSAGWRINGDGTAEFSNVVVRGGVYANYGQIGGNAIDSTGMQSPGYVAGSSGWRLDSSGAFYANNISLRGQITGGAFTGYGWPAAGAGNGFYLGPSGLLLGNYNDGQYLQVTAAGAISAPGFSISGGVATFSGALSSAMGTFSGSLTAAAVNAVDTINLAGQAVTIPVSAYSAGTITINTGESVLQTVTLNSSGAPVFITGCFSYGLAGDSSATAVHLRRNGTIIFSAYPAVGQATLACTDVPGAGPVTYQMTFAQSYGIAEGSSRSLMCLEVKR